MVLKYFIPLLIVTVSCTSISVRIPVEPKTLHDSTCFASVLSTDNNQLIEDSFTLDKETKLKIVAQGEGVSYGLTSGFVESYLNDCVEFFINSDSICRQYRFVWDSKIVQGNNVDMNGVCFAQGDPSTDSYLFEVSFPWKTLGFERVPPKEGKVRLDVSVIANDAESRKSQIAWSGYNSDLFQDRSQFGNLDLTDRWTAKAPIIDGVVDDIWGKYQWYEIEHEILGEVSGEYDLSGRFCIICDDENLYLIVNVKDNVKRQAAFMFDDGRIVNSAGDIVWEIEFSKTIHAGGALKNRMAVDTILLNAGNYTIVYETDESHSYGHWDDTPPTNQFSGIKIYELDI